MAELRLLNNPRSEFLESTTPYKMIKRLHIIINPAAGHDQPILYTLNTVLGQTRIKWEVFITKNSGDASRFTKQALDMGADAVASYGGDGTLMEVANGLMGSDVPLVILPGGTANVMSLELGIPTDLAQACQLLVDQEFKIRTIDIGQLGSRSFLTRIGLGFEAEMIRGAGRQMKDRLGIWAYILSALKAMRKSKRSRYDLNLEGHQVVTEGMACLIANCGNLGIPGLSINPNILIDDGFLDVIIIRDTDFASFASVVKSVVGGTPNKNAFEHWQVKAVQVHSVPAQIVQCDGELLGRRSVEAKIVPRALKVIVPKPAPI